MLLSQVVNVLGCERLLPLEGIDETVIAGCFAADLMSEVLAFCGHGALLVTGLATVQAVRTAAIADLAGVVFTRGKTVPPEVVALAKETRVPVFRSPRSLFEAAGALYAALGLEAAQPERGRGA